MDNFNGRTPAAALLLLLLATAAAAIGGVVDDDDESMFVTRLTRSSFSCTTSFYRQSAVLLPHQTATDCTCDRNSVTCRTTGLTAADPRGCLLTMEMRMDSNSSEPVAVHWRQNDTTPGLPTSFTGVWSDAPVNGLTNMSTYERRGGPLPLGGTYSMVVCQHVNFEDGNAPALVDLSVPVSPGLPAPTHPLAKKMWPALLRALAADDAQ